jgi:hypothetical protein
MEYFLGSLFTLIIFAFVSKVLKRSSAKLLVPTKNRQSIRFDSIRHIIPILNLVKPRKETQSTVSLRKNSIPVIFVDNEAYWIKDNRLYTAMLVNGKIDAETTKVVDTMTMNKLQLDKTIFIVEKLKEGFKNDSGNSGNKDLW